MILTFYLSLKNVKSYAIASKRSLNKALVMPEYTKKWSQFNTNNRSDQQSFLLFSVVVQMTRLLFSLMCSDRISVPREQNLHCFALKCRIVDSNVDFSIKKYDRIQKMEITLVIAEAFSCSN